MGMIVFFCVWLSLCLFVLNEGGRVRTYLGHPQRVYMIIYDTNPTVCAQPGYSQSHDTLR